MMLLLAARKSAREIKVCATRQSGRGARDE